MKKVNHRLTRQLLLEIDENGRQLTAKEIEIVSDLIDRKVEEFDAGIAKRIKQMHEKRVVNTNDEDEL